MKHAKHWSACYFTLHFACLLHGVDAFAPGFLSSPKTISCPKPSQSFAMDESSQEKEEDDEKVEISSIKIDDGGSDLTDRFKYKVNALMGVFDPQGIDDERQDGNILNAMLSFPVRYSFNVVGRTGGEDDLREQFVEQVKKVVRDTTGDEDGLQCQITPRGKNFTKISVQASVESAAMISNIYEELEALELTIMRF